LKIFYIYLTDIRETWANIIQTLQMCEALSKGHEVSFFHPFLLHATLSKRLRFLHIEKGLRITRIVAFGPIENRYLDFANRIIFFSKSYFISISLNTIYTGFFLFSVFIEDSTILKTEKEDNIRAS